MGDDYALEIAGIGTIKIKMFDGTIHIIGEVRHVNDLKKNLLSFGQIDSHGCKKSYVFLVFKQYKARVELESGKMIESVQTASFLFYVSKKLFRDSLR